MGFTFFLRRTMSGHGVQGTRRGPPFLVEPLYVESFREEECYVVRSTLTPLIPIIQRRLDVPTQNNEVSIGRAVAKSGLAEELKDFAFWLAKSPAE